MCFPSIQPVYYLNNVKVVQWPRYTEARILHPYALKKMISRDQMYSSISLLMSYKENHLQM